MYIFEWRLFLNFLLLKLRLHFSIWLRLYLFINFGLLFIRLFIHLMFLQYRGNPLLNYLTELVFAEIGYIFLLKFRVEGRQILWGTLVEYFQKFRQLRVPGGVLYKLAIYKLDFVGVFEGVVMWWEGGDESK